MATERLIIEVTERGTRRVTTSIERIGLTAERGAPHVRRLNEQLEDTTPRLRRIEARTRATTTSFGGLVRGLTSFRGALATLGTGLLIRELVQLSDEATNLTNRLRVVVDDQERLVQIQGELFEISRRTRSEVAANAELFSRLSLATRELGRSEAELLQFTESLNQAIKISGASAAESRAGLIQLSQGLASGALRGDELRSVLEQLPAVADVIAKSLGVTRGQLRTLGEQGQITAEVILDAFKESREELAERFARTIPTIGEAAVGLKNSVLELVGALNTVTGASSLAAQGLQALADAISATARVISSLDPQNLNRLLQILVFGTKEAINREADLLTAIEASTRAIRLQGLAVEEEARKARANIDTREDLTAQLKAEADQRERIKALIQTTPDEPAPVIRGTIGLEPLGTLTPRVEPDLSDADLALTDLENTFLDFQNTIIDGVNNTFDAVESRVVDTGDTFSSFGRGLLSAFQDIDLSLQGLGATFSNLFVSAVNDASVALADFAISGLRDTDELKSAFSDLFQQLARDILAATIRLIILKSLFGEGVGGGGGLLGALGLNPAGGRQVGGPIAGGETVLVGERGPELFTAPTGGGRVTRNEDISPLGLRPVVNVRIINVLGDDPGGVGAEAGGGDREEEILNVIQKNRGEVREILT